MMGFAATARAVSVGDLKIEADWFGNGNWVSEFEEDFAYTYDNGVFTSSTFEHDAAGNLTFDGVFHYAYDAWNRQVSVSRRRPGGSNYTVLSHSEYDGLGRRTMRGTQGALYRFYYDGQQLIETRSGSGNAIRQQVWGVQYIDELVQVSLNSAPASSSTADVPFWAMQDANFNVLGLVDAQGVLVERYEYTPYGQRTVYFSAGPGDHRLHAPTQQWRRWVAGGVAQAWGLNDFGHQGLQHDEEVGLIYNRARMLHPTLGRFMQRDPLGYVDGMGLYEYVRSRTIRTRDPSGLAAVGIEYLVGARKTFPDARRRPR